MAKITLPDTDSGYNIATINANFQKIEDELNNKVLYRDNPAGEPNAVSNDLDMNSKKLYNLAPPVNNTDAARLQDVQNAITGAKTANLVTFNPAGSIAATNVQAAIEELDGEKLSLTGGTLTGNLTFSGNSRKILGDFSNATLVNRMYFQDNTTNNPTVIGILPNGTSTTGGIGIFNNSVPTNSGLALIQTLNTEITIRSDRSGSGTYLPITFYTNGSERMRIDTSGRVGIAVVPYSWSQPTLDIRNLGLYSDGSNFVVANNGYYDGVGWKYKNTNPAAVFLCNTNTFLWYTAPSGTAGNPITLTEQFKVDGTTGLVLASNCNGIGYGSGSGSSITQATSKSTPVTINKATGQITLNSATLAPNTTVQFTVNCTFCSDNDIPVVAIQSNTAAYIVTASNVSAGSFAINVRNITGGSLSEGFVINYAIIKGSRT